MAAHPKGNMFLCDKEKMALERGPHASADFKYQSNLSAGTHQGRASLEPGVDAQSCSPRMGSLACP